MSDGNIIYDGPSFAESPDFYEAPDHPLWCPKCERWDENCQCPDSESEESLFKKFNPNEPLEIGLTLDQTESTCDIYDHCRHCGAGGNLWYGLCDKCNEESK